MPTAVIAASSSGNNEIVAAHTSPTAKKIQVIAYWLSSSGTVNAKWRSASTDKSGLLYCVANVGIVVPGLALSDEEFKPWYETVAGEALNLNLSAAVAVGGAVVYELG